MLHLGDCRLIITPDIIPDCLITDPPYRAHVHSNAVSQSSKRGTRLRDFGFTYLSPELRRWTCALAARTRRWSIIFSDIESVTWWRLSLQAAGARYVRTIPWVRWSMPQLSGDRPPTGAEMVVVAYNGVGKMSWNGPGNLTHFAHKCLRGEGKHKTEKPLDLMLDLVSYFSNEGELVCDPFSGAGTTATACAILNRQYIAVEQDSVWHEYSRLRVLAAGDNQFPAKRDAERIRRWDASRQTQKTTQEEETTEGDAA